MSLGGGRHSCNFCDVISIENLLAAWREFRKGKRSKKDVANFELNLEDNIFELHRKLAEGSWQNDSYSVFKINDPKPRIIHKASVRDRVLFQAVYRRLYPIFDGDFVFDSYSSRIGKGTHAGVKRFAAFAKKVSANHGKGSFVLKCDIKKFFDSIDHQVLFLLVAKKIDDEKLLSLIWQIFRSFECLSGKGLPLGNVTSQLFANVYLNELDQFVKHKLKAKFYIRYCDDFVILHQSNKVLLEWVEKIKKFCQEFLLLNLHGRKTIIWKIHWGTDFLGYVILPHRVVLRTRTRKRMFRMINNKNLPSYLGLLSHCKSWKLKEVVIRLFYDLRFF